VDDFAGGSVASMSGSADGETFTPLSPTRRANVSQLLERHAQLLQVRPMIIIIIIIIIIITSSSSIGIPSHYPSEPPSIGTFKHRLKSFYFNSLVS